ncbi:hypothetical protein [Undibacterium sp. TJN19]|uniref:hypothetical protein n=1 Tax=Undibacterium sp. TJN19 TaxID=3413055 RepID=UPI003BF22C2B
MSTTAKRICLHIFLILIVLILPPVVYDFVSSSSLSHLSHVNGLDMTGGLAYPAYFSYWVTRLRSARARLILLHLIALLTISFFTLEASGRSTPLFVILLPAIVGLITLPIALLATSRGQKPLAVNCLLSSLVNGPLGLILSLLTIYGAGMGAMSGMRW